MGSDRAASVTLRSYLSYFRGSSPVLVGAAGLLMLTGALPAIAVGLLRMALNHLLAHESAAVEVAALVAIAALHWGVVTLRARLTRSLAWTLVHRLRMKLHEKFFQLGELPEVGSRLAALTVEVEQLQYGVSAIVTLIRAPIALLCLVGTALYLAPGLALRFLVLLPVVGLVAWIGGGLVRRRTGAWRDARERYLIELTDQHNGLQTAVDLHAEEVQFQRAHRLSVEESRARADLEWIRALPSGGTQFAVVLALALLLWWGQAQLSVGTTHGGDLVGFAAAVGLAKRPLSQLTEVWTLWQRSATSMQRIEAFLAEPSRRRPSAERFELTQCSVTGRLAPIDLTIRSGEKIAIVGASGAGKSTLLRVLAGELPCEGEAKLCRSLFLRQDPWIFSRTLKDNLRLGAPSCSQEDLENVLSIVELTELCERLNDPIGARGAKLSGGEGQRVCVARALLGEGEVLLLDEATSEVEAGLASRIAARLAARDQTVIFASHRAFFAHHADRVLFFCDGVLRLQGTHDELLQHSSYRELWG